MAILIENLETKGLIQPPKFLAAGLQYLTKMGSFAYGTSLETSDLDIYGFAIPPKSYIFPYSEGGYIRGFGAEPPNYEQWSETAIKCPDEGKDMDFQVYNIVKTFELCRQGNPNMLDSLFTPDDCVIYSTRIGKMVRDNRKLFLSKAVWLKMKGYVFSQIKKLESGNGNPTSPARQKTIQTFGVDTKYLAHIFRLLNQSRQIAETGDMNLRDKANVMLEIRNGKWPKDKLFDWAKGEMKSLDTAFEKSSLPDRADETKLRDLLHSCLALFYSLGSQPCTK